MDTDTFEKKTVPHAIIGILSTVSGIASLLILPITGSLILVGLGGVFGLIALIKIGKNPNKLRGKGLAWFSIIIAFLCIIVPLVLLWIFGFA